MWFTYCSYSNEINSYPIKSSSLFSNLVFWKKWDMWILNKIWKFVYRGSWHWIFDHAQQNFVLYYWQKNIQFSNVQQMCDPMRLNSPHYLTPLKKKKEVNFYWKKKINADCFTKLQKIRNEENLRKRHARPKEDGD